MTLDHQENKTVLLLNTIFTHPAIELEEIKAFITEKAKLIENKADYSTEIDEFIKKLIRQNTQYKMTQQIKDLPKFRGLVDGVFDIAHFGHFNAFRQARRLCDELIVAINGTEEVYKAKGSYPLYNSEERLAMVNACKWVTESHEVPDYYLKTDVLDNLKVDCVMHGDDAIFQPDGSHAYGEFIKLQKYIEYKRTQGISTTDITDRILNLHNPEFMRVELDKHCNQKKAKKFNCIISKIVQFWDNRSINKFATGKVVYVTGGFDILHPGHVEFLKEAKKLGDTLIVGLHGDSLINKLKGLNYPIMTINERMMNLLSIGVVDDIILDAPYFIDEVFLTDFNISIVADGCRNSHDKALTDPFEVPKKKNQFVVVSTKCGLTTDKLVERINGNRELIQDAIERKKVKQANYYEYEQLRKTKTIEI